MVTRGERGDWITIQCREGEESKSTIFSAGGDAGYDVVVEMRPCGNCGLFWESDTDQDNIFVPHTHVFSNIESGSASCVSARPTARAGTAFATSASTDHRVAGAPSTRRRPRGRVPAPSPGSDPMIPPGSTPMRNRGSDPMRKACRGTAASQAV